MDRAQVGEEDFRTSPRVETAEDTATEMGRLADWALGGDRVASSMWMMESGDLQIGEDDWSELGLLSLMETVLSTQTQQGESCREQRPRRRPHPHHRSDRECASEHSSRPPPPASASPTASCYVSCKHR